MPFISRGDESGTHEREQQLWAEAGVAPSASRLVVSGQGMGGTLRIASEMEAYTLTDRGTFLQLARQLRLKELYSGDPRLLNTYAVIFPAANPAARAFAEWLTDGGGVDTLSTLISSGRILGFERWPDGKPRDRPDAPPY
jgi:tungstate transport system substrate-binding protein